MYYVIVIVTFKANNCDLSKKNFKRILHFSFNLNEQVI